MLWKLSSLSPLNGPLCSRMAVALIVTCAFAFVARLLRAVTPLGALTGAILCFLLYACVGGPAVAALVAVFVLAWLSTKIALRRKLQLGTAENANGRNASQIAANLGVAALCATLYAFTGRQIFVLALAAALSEAAADTVSSEVGQSSRSNPRLITTWKEVLPGTDGGVTLLGTLSGLAAATVVTFVCVAGGLLPPNRALIPMLSALAGTFADSFLGATLERRRLLNNDLVNLFGTLVAALLAFALCR